MVKVSIIVPNYNYRRYLPQRLDSIFRQTYADYEVILLDDCSTDDSQSLLRQYDHHPKVSHVVINTTNSGSPFLQWEKGIALAQGEYIWIAECDDYCTESFLAHSAKALDEHPEAAFTLCGSHIVDGNGNPRDWNFDCWEPGEDDGKTRVYSSGEYLRLLFYHCTAYNASMIVFRKGVYQQIVKDDFTSMRYCGDWLFWIKMAEHGSVALRRERQNYFRRHGDCVTLSAPQKEVLEEKLYIFSYMWRRNSSLLNKMEKLVFRGFVYKEISRTAMGEDERKKILKRMSKMGVGKAAFLVERVAKIFSPKSKH